MAELRAFGKRARQLGANVADGADALVRRVAVAVDTAVVLATPVDTGRARSNWQVNIGSPASGTVPTFGNNAASKAVAAAQAQIGTYRGGSAIHITNNLAYIGRLNDGYSAQAPAGFVSAAVVAGALTVREARLIIKNGDRVIAADLGRIG